MCELNKSAILFHIVLMGLQRAYGAIAAAETRSGKLVGIALDPAAPNLWQITELEKSALSRQGIRHVFLGDAFTKFAESAQQSPLTESDLTL